MMATSVGAMGHKPGLSKSKSELAPYRSTWIIFLLLLVFKFRHFTREPAFWPLTSLAAGYFLVLAIVNYQDYTTLGFLGAGLQGRYFFPVLPAFYVIVAKVLGEKNYKEWLSILFTILVFYYFLQGGFFYFLENVPKPWLL
jgi:hypothetical protein